MIIEFLMVTLSWTPLIAFGAVMRTILGVYKAYDTFPDFQLDWKMIFVEVVASTFFGSFGFYFLQAFGIFNFGLELAAPIAGLLGADVVRPILRKVGMKKDLEIIVSKQQMKNADLNSHEVRAMDYVGKYGKINNHVYQKINFVGIDTAKRELNALVQKGRLAMSGATKGANYTIPAKKESGGNLAVIRTSKTIARKTYQKTPDRNSPSVKPRLEPAKRIFQKSEFGNN